MVMVEKKHKLGHCWLGVLAIELEKKEGKNKLQKNLFLQMMKQAEMRDWSGAA